MQHEKAQHALARLNISLPSLTVAEVENLVYGRGVTVQTLTTMHQAASSLVKRRKFGKPVEALMVESHGALKLKALNGDRAARVYLDELSKV